MSEQDVGWSRQELLRGGTVMIAVFAAMYALAIVEILMSFREFPDGPLLRLFLTRFPFDQAGYHMVMTLTIFWIAGGGLYHYGIKWIRRGLKLPKA